MADQNGLNIFFLTFSKALVPKDTQVGKSISAASRKTTEVHSGLSV